MMESGGSFICASCGGGFIQPITVGLFKEMTFGE